MRAWSCNRCSLILGVRQGHAKHLAMAKYFPKISSSTQGKDSAKAATGRKGSRLTCGGVKGSCQQAQGKEDAQPIHGARTGRGAGQVMDPRLLWLQAHQNASKASGRGVGTAAEEWNWLKKGSRIQVESCRRAADALHRKLFEGL